MAEFVGARGKVMATGGLWRSLIGLVLFLLVHDTHGYLGLGGEFGTPVVGVSFSVAIVSRTLISIIARAYEERLLYRRY